MPLLRVLAGSQQFGLLLAAFIIAACVHALCAQFIRAEGHTTLSAIVYGAVNLTVPLPPMSLVTFDAPAPLLAGQQRAAAHR